MPPTVVRDVPFEVTLWQRDLENGHFITRNGKVFFRFWLMGDLFEMEESFNPGREAQRFPKRFGHRHMVTVGYSSFEDEKPVLVQASRIKIECESCHYKATKHIGDSYFCKECAEKLGQNPEM